MFLNTEVEDLTQERSCIVYLQEARVSSNRQVKLGCVCDEQDIVVDVNGRSDCPEEEREDVSGLMWRDEDGCAEVLHLRHRREKVTSFHSAQLRSQ